jgi:hypothetical protein
MRDTTPHLSRRPANMLLLAPAVQYSSTAGRANSLDSEWYSRTFTHHQYSQFWRICSHFKGSSEKNH